MAGEGVGGLARSSITGALAKCDFDAWTAYFTDRADSSTFPRSCCLFNSSMEAGASFIP
ncbi:hypothetical protein KIN20_025702 [Parelaphostrongylus tenuis]|uniref:Uncharacterized protein n=1 Tax=Parelaphostrongylus tenuis TaxID=148309 RepID=A0AAD5QXC8_PARTN|nr:hypothetical protein KIN20_025702 [Parelaphostrongylus tenuis]